MTGEELKAIEARLTAATPGPWRWENDGDGRTLVTEDDQVVGGAILWARDANDRQVDLQVTEQDANLIAHAYRDIRALLTEVRRLHSALASDPPVAGEHDGGC